MRLFVALPGLSIVGLLVCSCGGGNAAARPDCPAGQTSLDGTCVSQQIADYVGCIRATGATVASDSAKSLAAAAGVAGVTGSTQAEVKDKLEKSYAKVSDENAQTIIRNCDNKTAPTATKVTQTELQVAGVWHWDCCGGAFHGTIFIKQDGESLTGTLTDVVGGVTDPIEGKARPDGFEFTRTQNGQHWLLAGTGSTLEGYLGDGNMPGRYPAKVWR